MTWRRNLYLRVLTAIGVTVVSLPVAIVLALTAIQLFPNLPLVVALIPSAIFWLIITPIIERRIYRRLKERYSGV